MLLAVDVGNTNTVVGVFDGDSMVASWRVSTDKCRMSDEYVVFLYTIFSYAGIPTDGIEGVIISSVVPQANRSLKECILSLFGLQPVFVTADMNIGIKMDYFPPEGVGADRIVNAVAAYFIYGGPAIVVDFGTASTFCAISEDGRYLGGAIAPGLLISRDALFASTARLPNISLEIPEHCIGKNVVESIRSGLIMGFASMVEGMVKRFKEEMKADAKVIATGGLMELIANQTDVVDILDQNLTLKGLRLIYERLVG